MTIRTPKRSASQPVSRVRIAVTPSWMASPSFTSARETPSSLISVGSKAAMPPTVSPLVASRIRNTAGTIAHQP